jgi:ribosomal protein S18 acetylase RimI-like enzyme
LGSPVIEIREARSEEHAAAGEVSVAAYAAFYGPNLGTYEEALRDVPARSRSAVVLVALDGSDLVGTVTYVPDAASELARQEEGEASIRMLAVSPRRTREGIGRALSVACVERARAEGKRAVVLHADEVMAASQRLYENLGFRRAPGRDYLPDDGTRLLGYVLKL